MLTFGRTEAAGLSELIAKRRFPKALEVIREQLKSRRRDPRLRRQLAEVLAMAGQPDQAMPLFLELAEDLALAGDAGKAIAILKRAQRLAPGQPEVEEQLAYHIAQEKAPASDPWARARSTSAEPPPPKYEAPPVPSLPGDLEEITEEAETPPEASSDALPLGEEGPRDDDLVLPSPPAPPEASSDALPLGEERSGDDDLVLPSPSTPPEAAAPAPSEALPPGDEAPKGDEEAFRDEAFRDEVLGLIEDVFSGRTAPESSEIASLPAVQSPLFSGFSVDELVEVIRGLELRSYHPGEIVVTEGQPADSLFVLTTGSVRTYVRDAEGGSAAVRVLAEGDFFGEVSLLEGSPRTATVTAAGRCELLEIDRLTLGNIARKHPRVWSVARRFYEERARSDAEVAARASSRTDEG